MHNFYSQHDIDVEKDIVKIILKLLQFYTGQKWKFPKCYTALNLGFNAHFQHLSKEDRAVLYPIRIGAEIVYKSPNLLQYDIQENSIFVQY